MKASIIIPALNEQANIGQLLQSLQTLRAQGHELILVDGGSCDQTLEIAKGMVDIVIQGAKGRALQQNLGAEKATGELFFFLHADSQLPANFALIVKQLLARQDEFWGRFNVRLSGQHFAFRLIERMMNWRSCLTGIATGDQLIFIKRKLFEKIAGFPAIALMEDIEISKRLKRYQKPLCLNEVIITSSSRWEKHGIIKTVLMMWWLRLNYFFGCSPETLHKRYYPSAKK